MTWREALREELKGWGIGLLVVGLIAVLLSVFVAWCAGAVWLAHRSLLAGIAYVLVVVFLLLAFFRKNGAYRGSK